MTDIKNTSVIDFEMCIRDRGWSTQEEITGYAGDTGEAFANQMRRWSQGLGNQDMIREACLRSGEAVDWMMDTGRTYEGASPLPPVWSCGDTEADVVPRSVYNLSLIHI